MQDVNLLLCVYTTDLPSFLGWGMVTGRQCSQHTGRNKLKVGREIQNTLLNSRKPALQGEKAKLTNNWCTCCKFIFPPSSSPLPATKNRKLRSEECVLYWRHVTWLLNHKVLLAFRTSNTSLSLLPLGERGAKMPGATLNICVVCKSVETFPDYVQILVNPLAIAIIVKFHILFKLVLCILTLMPCEVLEKKTEIAHDWQSFRDEKKKPHWREVQTKGNKPVAAFKVMSWETWSLCCPLLVGCRAHRNSTHFNTSQQNRSPTLL